MWKLSKNYDFINDHQINNMCCSYVVVSLEFCQFGMEPVFRKFTKKIKWKMKKAHKITEVREKLINFLLVLEATLLVLTTSKWNTDKILSFLYKFRLRVGPFLILKKVDHSTHCISC